MELQESVRVPSLKDRRTALADEGRNPPLINLSIPWEPEIKPVLISWRVIREDTGGDITKNVNVVISDAVAEPGGKPMTYRIQDNPMLLHSGRTYSFAFSKTGFVPVEALARLDAGISRYRVEVGMRPEPAVLVLSSAIPFKKPRLQGDTTYRHGGDEGGFRKLQMMNSNAREYVLPPGEYRLSAGGEEKNAVRNLLLSPGTRLLLRFEKNEDGSYAWTEVVDE